MPNKVSASGFAALPYKLMEQADVPTWAVYAVLHRHGWSSDQGCWTSIETIRKETGIARAVIQRCLRWLKASGWVEARKRQGFTTVYFVKTDPPEQGLACGKTTQVKSDPGQIRPTPQVISDLPPRSNLTHEQEPKNKNPRTKTQKGASAESGKKDPNTRRKLALQAIPGDLTGCADLLIEFWQCKKGTRSTNVLNRICNKLRQWSLQDRRTALEAAINNGWGDVYPPKKQTAYSPVQEPAHKHPAHRVFTADNGFGPDNSSNGVLKDFF